MNRPQLDPSRIRCASIENLEHRRLMAAINVADFGAVPNDGQDDTAAINAAINASRAGDTIHFGEGTFDISSELVIRSNRTYKGWDATIKRHGTGFAMGTDGFNYNITIDSLTLDGGGFTLNGEKTGEAILIRDSRFQNISGGFPYGNAILVGPGLVKSKITRNEFVNILGETGIYGFNVFDKVEMSNNYFEDVFEGIHLYYNRGGSDLKVINNSGIRFRRMGIELQGLDARNTLVEGNRFTDWVDPYHGSFGLSIMNYGSGTVIRNNFVEGPHEAPVGIEVGGTDSLVENNTINGFREGMHIVGATGTEIRNNVFNNQGMMAIWRTGVDQAHNVRIHSNTIRDPKWTAFLFSTGNSEGTVVEDNTIVNATRAFVVHGGGANGVTFGDNRLENVAIVREG